MEKEDEEMNCDFESAMTEEKEEAAGSAAPPSNGALLVKLRLPKAAAEEDRAAEKGGGHNCRECSKSFSSGKALGGHMSSAHVQASKDYSYKKLNCKNKTKRKQEDMIGCPHCDKTFPTDKSLFGHMRCHPDRQYRGMEPPRPDCSSGLKTLHDSGFVSTFQDWPSTSKRGRGYVRAPETFSAGHQLLKLINGGRPESSPGNGKGNSESQGSSSVSELENELYWTAIEVLVEWKRATMENEIKRVIKEGGKVDENGGGVGRRDRCSHNKPKLNIIKEKTKTKKKEEEETNGRISTSDDEVEDDGDGDGDDDVEKVVLGFDLNMMPADLEEDHDVNGQHCIHPN